MQTKLLVNGEWKTYQDHNLTAILPLEEIMDHLEKNHLPLDHAVYYIGTVPLLMDFTYAEAYEMVMTDPVWERSITLQYDVFQIQRS